MIRDANAVDTELFSLGVGARWAEISAPVFLSTADDGWCNSICSKGPRIGAGPAAFCHQVMPLALAY